MTKDTFKFKGKIIHGNNLELTFHKEVFGIYNEKLYPVVKYTLTNFRNLESIKFDSIDFYDDGLIIDTKLENGLSIFETVEMSGDKIKITCDKIEKEEREYNNQEFVDKINEIIKQRESEFDVLTMLTNQKEHLKQFLNHELEIVTRKIAQADWLNEDKKYFLLGQQETIKKVLDTIDKK